MQNLINAVAEQMGYESDDQEWLDTMADVARGGADAGWAGFTYYTDTAQFYDDNKTDIIQQLHSDADDFGSESVAHFVASFNCVTCSPLNVDAVMLGDGKEEVTTQVKNAIAWYALETVARWVE